MDYDVIVIGSGFGGAISACRLAEAGYRVLILERGRRWNKATYPRRPEDPWVWNHLRPEAENGWIDLRTFPGMTIAQGAAVGGGSLIYANISCEAPAKRFEQGWPPEVTYAELKPYYDKVAAFMNVQKVPMNQWTQRMKLMQEGAVKIGQPERFKQLELAVSFDPEWTYARANAHDPSSSRRFVNAQGVEQGTCIHLGNCDIGCEVGAKNTLDHTYIPWAEKHGAQVRPLHIAGDVAPVDGGYRVSYDELKGGLRLPGSATARLVIVAAGSLGSTELLLRCRDVNGSLPAISRFLGRDWSSNGDFLTPALYDGRDVSPSRGPTIASAIDFLDGSQSGETFWIEDGGIPNLLGDYLRTRQAKSPSSLYAKLLIDGIRDLLASPDPFKSVMPWFAQGVDAGNGLLGLRRRWWLFGPRELHLDWDVTQSKPVVDAIVAMHMKLSKATGGLPLVPPTWSVAQDLVTPHPLGGCNMGPDSSRGVVDHRGEVFGYPNLYVADAAIIPEALGVNPSRTIGALSERIAALIIAGGK